LAKRKSARSRGARDARRWPAAAAIASYAAAFGIALLIYHPSLRGPFLHDDHIYLTMNPHVQQVSVDNLLAILDPRGEVTLRTANYAPLHLLGHMAEWALFGDRLLAYHVVNVALHAWVTVLLIGLLRDSGVPPRGALLAGGLFLVHPANVEAVAWISQLKTVLAMALMLVALRVRRRRPVVGALAFALALMAKALAAVALPVALLLEWARGGAGPAGRRVGDLVFWGVALSAFAVVEFWALGHVQTGNVPLSEDVAVRVWTTLAIAARYLVMAATSYGVSAWHQPGPTLSPLDPWVLAAFAFVAGLGALLLRALRGRREEAAWWAWALLSFLPVAQITPFLYPMADRYLYFILPGLLGGCLLAGRDALATLGRSTAERLARAAQVAAVGLAFVFAWHSVGRAELWTSEQRTLGDAMRNYPDGATAHYSRALEAAARGDGAVAVAHLRRASARGQHGLTQLFRDPGLARLHGQPEFQELLRQLARRHIETGERLERLSEANRIKLAQAHLIAGEPERAVEILEQMLAAGTKFEPTVRASLAQARWAAQRRRQLEGSLTP